MAVRAHRQMYQQPSLLLPAGLQCECPPTPPHPTPLLCCSPYRSYAPLPGATQCVRCVAGIAICVAGNGCDDGNNQAPTPGKSLWMMALPLLLYCCWRLCLLAVLSTCHPACVLRPPASFTTTAAAGYQVLSVTTPNDLKNTSCNLASQYSYGNPPLMSQCSLASSGVTYLSVYVDASCGGEEPQHGWCEVPGTGQQSLCALGTSCRECPPAPCPPSAVQLSPMKDDLCSEPAASYWSTMKMRGYYVTPTRIANVLNTAATNITRCGAGYAG